MDFLTARDKEILELTSVFGGKIFVDVLIKTFWINHKMPKSQARNRMDVLTNKYNLFMLKPTGLMSPRSAYVLTEYGKGVVKTLFDKDIYNVAVTTTTVKHNILEMITFYWLQKLGKNPTRTTVANWGQKQNFKHTPDIAYRMEDNRLVYIEIETTVKSAGSYNSIFANIIQDKVHKIIYVLEDEKKVAQFVGKLPTSERLMLVSIDTLVNSAQSGKIGAKSQKEILK
ncbi:MAG: hypothetical protein RBR02_09590 [Desulfuromonadaceae bacterium]|nr:hypothetical protein [Desulfuromonadaceae bacterium]